MSGRLPVELDPLDLADKGREIEGRVPVSAFRRLGEWLDSDSGSIEARLHFERTPEGRRVLRGALSGELELVCQRCLTPFALPVERTLELVLVEDEAAARLLPEELEPLAVGHRRVVHTTDLLEDELILALPMVPRCSDFGHLCKPAAELLVSDQSAPRDEEE